MLNPIPTPADLGLGNVNNTSDANKPVSTATATALAGKLGTSGNGSAVTITAGRTGEVARTFAAHMVDVTNAKDFGTVGDGTTDDTAALNAALDATPVGGTLVIPAGTYLLKGAGRLTSTSQRSLLLAQKNIRIVGAGFVTVLYVDSTVASTVDVLTIDAPAQVAYPLVSDLLIAPNSGTPARNGIVFEATGTSQSYANASVERVYVESRAGVALLVNNPNHDHNAFIGGRIFKCELLGGAKFDGTGDSMTVEGCILTTSGSAATAGKGPSIYLYSQAGAATNVITRNNLTAVGGGVIAAQALQLKILYNQFEQPASPTGTNLATIDLRGTSGQPISQAEIRGNNIGGTSGTYDFNIRADYTTDLIVEDNTITAGGGVGADSWAGVGITANAVNTWVGPNVWGGFSDPTKRVSDSGTGTAGLEKPLTWQNGYANLGGYPVASVRKDRSGRVYFAGVISSGAGTHTVGTLLATLPAGFRPPALMLISVPGLNGSAVGTVDLWQVETNGNITAAGNGIAATLYSPLTGLNFTTAPQ
jgi:hypothetical protein